VWYYAPAKYAVKETVPLWKEWATRLAPSVTKSGVDWMLQDLLIINIIGCGVAVTGTLLGTGWSRAVSGVWPGRTKVRFLVLMFLTIWALGNMFYFYLKWRG